MIDNILKPENTPILETDRLTLRAVSEKDANDLYGLLSDKEVNTFLPWFPAKNLKETGQQLHDLFLKHYDEKNGYRYAVCLKTDNRPIGYIILSSGKAHDLGYALKKDFWHKGIATEACKAVIRRIAAAGYTYVTATHDVQNLKSGEVMKRIGMKYKYSYTEHWQPKNLQVTFRMYQLNFDGNDERTYMEYWNTHSEHFVEEGL